MMKKGILDTIEDQPFTTSYSTIMSGTLYSEHLKMDWNYAVYLPLQAIQEPDKRFPVLYLLHGLYGNYRNYLERLELQQLLDEWLNTVDFPMIVVFIDGFNSFYIDQVDGMSMESAVIQDLIPWMEANFPVEVEKKNRAIGGISMGGYGAARLSLKFPEFFQYTVMISPAVWQVENAAICRELHAFNDGQQNWSEAVYLEQFPQVNGKTETEFFIVTTQMDSVVPVEDVRMFAEKLKEQDIVVDLQMDDLLDHNWDYWKLAVKDVCQWLLKKWIEKNG